MIKGLSRALVCLLCSTLPLLSAAQKQQISLTTELKRLSDLQQLPLYEQNIVWQKSSYDTTGNNDDGFSGKYSFVRRNPDSSLVIFEATGPGVINRIWTPTPNDDLLDFYFGGASKPAFSIRFSDLFSNKIFPFVLPLCGNQLGGYYCYLPITFRNGCKIVSRGKKMEFYQIQHRAFPKGTKVRDFSLKLTAAETAAVKELGQHWSQRISNPKIEVQCTSTKTLRKALELKAGAQISVVELTDGGRISSLRLYPASAFAGLEKQLDLRITWDDESTPAVYAPVADFFGFAFGSPSMQSLLLGTRQDTLYLNFPMPFDEKAKIELLYRATEQTASRVLKVSMEVQYNTLKRKPASEGRFYAYWHKNANAKPGAPHTFLEGQGRGHYVGTILQAQGLEPGMTLFFEGDDQTYVDGKLTMHGTGSEDYFNGGWYAMLDRWDTKMSLPLHGALDYSLPFSRTGGYRIFLADKLSFQKSFKHTIEHGPEQNNKPADYTSMAFYYADHALSTRQQQPVNALTEVYLPDTLMLYPQLMNYSVMGNFCIDGNVITANTSGNIRINLSEIPAGRYKLYADLESNTAGAVVSLWQRQSLLRDSISFRSANKEIKDRSFLVPIELDAFKPSITFHFDREQEGKKIWINRLIFIRDKNGM